MAQRIVITLECDVCGVEDETVKTRRLMVDTMRKPQKVEACSTCYPTDELKKLLAVARKDDE